MLGDRIKEMLIFRNKKPADLARESGLSRSLISEIINGKRNSVTIETASKIAQALGIKVDYLIDRGEMIGPIEIFKHLSEEEKEFVADENNAPFIKLTAQAARKGLTPEQLDYLIRAVVEFSK